MLAPDGHELTLTDLDAAPHALLQIPNHIAKRGEHELGRALFESDWTRAIHFDEMLSPHYDHTSCTGCHTEGQTRIREADGVFRNRTAQVRVLRVLDSDLKSRFGAQINQYTIGGGAPLGRLELDYVRVSVRFEDGTRRELEYPVPRIVLRDPVAHAAPTLFGWGLLGTVDDAVLHRMADPNDKNRDGISGTLRMVWSINDQNTRPGR